jgi:hypothetical protein
VHGRDPALVVIFLGQQVKRRLPTGVAGWARTQSAMLASHGSKQLPDLRQYNLSTLQSINSTVY